MITYPHINEDWTDFKRNQYGKALSDVIETTVIEERNGIFDAEIKYPYDGENSDMLIPGAIISVPPAPEKTAEPFRIYDIQKDINGVINGKTHHIVYDADGVILEPFTALTVGQIVDALNTHYAADYADFEVTVNGYNNLENFELKTDVPASLWSMIGKAAEVMNAELGYQYHRNSNKLIITLYRARGKISTATIAYGVNLLKMAGGQNNAGVYTAIYPYYRKDDGQGNVTYVTLPEKTIGTGESGRTRILTVDLTPSFESTPTVEELRAAANKYVAEQDFSVIDSVQFDFVPLASTTEYGNTAAAQQIGLCDIVDVKADPIGVRATAKVVKTVYNPLLGKYNSMTVGEIRPTIADTIARLEREVRK